MTVAILLALLGVAAPASAEDAGFLRRDDLRYPHKSVFERVAMDLVAAPATVVDWRAAEWATFAAVAVSVGTLMAPLDPSLDVRFDDWVTREVDPWLPDIWSFNLQAPLWTTLAVGSFGLWGAAAYNGEKPIAETMSLMGEAVAVTQFYHLALKLSIGRGEDGVIRGFPASLEQFPRGTPGGHFGTLYAMFGTVEAYWRPHWSIRVGGHTLLALGALTHALNHRHFVSEQIFGASIGYAVSQWVVRNRSTRFAFDEAGRPLRLGFAPYPGGLAVFGRF